MAIPNGAASDITDDIDFSDLEAKWATDLPVHRSSAHGENFSIRYKVVVDETLDSVVVLDGAPVIDRSRCEKLLTKISKEFAKRGSTISANNITVPWDDSTGKSKGSVHLSSVRLVLISDPLVTFSWNLRLARMPSTLSTP